MNFEIVSYEIDSEAFDEDCDEVGTIILKDTDTGEFHEHTLWNGSDGECYFCYDTGEYDENGDEITESEYL